MATGTLNHSSWHTKILKTFIKTYQNSIKSSHLPVGYSIFLVQGENIVKI